jgi:hypothetical protein
MLVYAHANQLVISQNIAILPEREPAKRTKTAYIDMYSREKAVHASYEVGAIYGLIVKIKLAVE